MSEHTKTFIDNLEAGKNADAGQAFKDALRDKMGNALDARRQELAASLFNKTPEADPISDPKPEVADVGTFTADGQVQNGMDAVEKDGKAELDLTQNAETETQ
tara:strand:+ start:358 stop:666 length:309 start_codon:yes stop_codon:yes gene_type:complete